MRLFLFVFSLSKVSEYFTTALVSSVKTWVSSPSSKILWWILHHTSVNKFYEISTIVNTLLSISHHGINNDVGVEKEQWSFYKTKIISKTVSKKWFFFIQNQRTYVNLWFLFDSIKWCWCGGLGSWETHPRLKGASFCSTLRDSCRHLLQTTFNWRQLKLPCTGTCLQIIVKKQNFLH